MAIVSLFIIDFGSTPWLTFANRPWPRCYRSSSCCGRRCRCRCRSLASWFSCRTPVRWWRGPRWSWSRQRPLVRKKEEVMDQSSVFSPSAKRAGKKIPDTKVYHQAGPAAFGSKSWTHRCSGNLHVVLLFYSHSPKHFQILIILKLFGTRSILRHAITIKLVVLRVNVCFSCQDDNKNIICKSLKFDLICAIDIKLLCTFCSLLVVEWQ